MAEQKEIPKTLTGMNSNQIGQLIELYKGQIAQALPGNITPERFILVVTSVIARNPELKQCTTMSVMGAILQSALLGLDVTPQIGHCAFIPRKDKVSGTVHCEFQIMYQGYIYLARQSQEIKGVEAHVVHQGDQFHYELGLEPKLVHVPATGNRGPMLYAYAIWRFKDGTTYFEVMEKTEILKAKKASPAADSAYSPWTTFEGEMWRKTAIRRSRKYVPLSIESHRRLGTDENVLELSQFSRGEYQLPTAEEPALPEGKEPSKPVDRLKIAREKAAKHTEEPKGESAPQEQEKPQQPGVCESCGTPAVDLSHYKGLLVCHECYAARPS